MLKLFLAPPRASSMVCVAVIDHETPEGTLRYKIPVWKSSGFDVQAEVYSIDDGQEFRLSKGRVPFDANDLRRLWVRAKARPFGESVTLGDLVEPAPGV